jgi:hypothetical protein
VDRRGRSLAQKDQFKIDEFPLWMLQIIDEVFAHDRYPMSVRVLVVEDSEAVTDSIYCLLQSCTDICLISVLHSLK